MSLAYKRVLLKLSGEALAGGKGKGFDNDVVAKICKGIKNVVETGAQLAIVVGGGNFWRGAGAEGVSVERFRSDQIGMLGTAMNALFLEDVLLKMGINVLVQSAVDISPIAKPYCRQETVAFLEKKGVVIFACGTGSPYFSTDTAAALRAAEINADIILKVTKVDGVYDSDPVTNPNAVKHKTLSFGKVISENLKVMDMSAAAMCRDNNIAMRVFSVSEPEDIAKVVLGEDLGTLVSG